MNSIIPASAGERWEVFDLGLYLNETEGHTFWKKEEIVQGYSFINGVDVYVTKHSGRAGWRHKSCDMFAVNIGGEVFSLLEKAEAIEIVDNIRIGDYIDAEYK